MRNYNDESFLKMVELYAAEMGYCASEGELSDDFDTQIAPMVVQQYGPDDTVAFGEAFNNWADGLCKDGVIHPEQYRQYCYIGRYS